ncbi:MAG: J domain-containing protein, partial [Kamptonema sp. SIO4C4]|nr:J domain-containing protein [Kamptonema sp. SIO4C4]
GQRIRLRGQGMNGGDLYLKINVNPHPVFEVQGADVFCRVPLTPSEAILGGLVEVPTLDGLVKMNVPKGVRSGQRLRLANKGYLRSNESRGDQLVEIQIALPTEISQQEAELYEKIRQIETFKPRQDLLK